MIPHDRLELVRDVYGAYESGDRGVVEQSLADDFTFSAPPDVGIDRATYFERCWPSSETTESFEYHRLFEANDEVVVTYEATRTDGRRFRNTETSDSTATRSAGWRSTSAGTWSEREQPGRRPGQGVLAWVGWTDPGGASTRHEPPSATPSRATRRRSAPRSARSSVIGAEAPCRR